MKMCQQHWDTLRLKIKQRGLGDFCPASFDEAVDRMKSQAETKDLTAENFDPLMSAHNMILQNAMTTIHAIGANPLMLFADDPEHPEWECPICCLNWLSAEHDKNCFDPECTKPKGLTYDDWLDMAADGSKNVVDRLNKK